MTLPASIVVVGGAGDLMRRKLFPALYRLSARELLPERTPILGAARRRMDDDAYRRWAAEALEAAGVTVDERTARWCEACLFYHSLGEGRAEDYRGLAARVETLERERERPANRVFYLAMPPQAVPTAITGLGESGLNRGTGWTRLVVEKPFGRDPLSAEQLNGVVHRYFDESQVYRIDHYLGKETVQNLLAFRFANPLFETQWNRDRVESVQITVAEEVGVEDRAAFYETAGALRDIVQNHLTQLLTLITMEVPTSLAADYVRSEKVKVLHAIQPVTSDDVVLGQYTAGAIDGPSVPGYREEPGVAPDSRTETFAAVRVSIENWRWHGVPFYLRPAARRLRDAAPRRAYGRPDALRPCRRGGDGLVCLCPRARRPEPAHVLLRGKLGTGGSGPASRASRGRLDDVVITPPQRHVVTWYGLPAVIKQSDEGLCDVAVPGQALPHPSLVNAMIRRGLPADARAPLAFLHELGHLQTLPFSVRRREASGGAVRPG